MTSHTAVRSVCAGIAVATLFFSLDSDGQKNRGKEFRSLNSDVYQIEIQKNGRVDVFLSDLNAAVYDAFPMIWFDDEDEPERMKTDGRWTQRYRVEDRLGDGSGMVQKYKTLEWSLRTYPSRPFFAVQLAYTNTEKKPVRVRALMPWCVGEPGKGAVMLGTGAENTRILTEAMRGSPALVASKGHSADAIAAWNPQTGRSLIAGFVTQARAAGRIEIGEVEGGEDPAFYRFRAVCEFEPPVTVEPGEQLLSEVLYLSFAESDPVTGMQRYARATEIVNKTGELPGPLRAWSLPRSSPQALPALLERATSMIRTSDVPYALVGDLTRPADAGTMETVAKGVTEAIKSSGLLPAIWCDPFVFPRSHAVVRDESGLFLHEDATSEVSLLDLGNPRTIELIEAIGRDLARAGWHAVAGIDLDQLAGATFSGGGTPTENVTEAVRALRRGLGDNVRIYASTPSLLATILTDGVVSGVGAAQQSVASTYIAPSSVAIRGAYNAQTEQALVAAALTDASLILDFDSVSRWPDAAARLAPIFPVSESRTVQADLFVTDEPRVLYERHENRIGVAHRIAVFNWSGSAESTALPLIQLGDAPGTYYTVFDDTAQRYLGTAADRLSVNVAPGNVSVLTLRPYVSRPMPLEIGTNLGETTPDIETYAWDPRDARLDIGTTGSGSYQLPFLVPEGMTADRVDSATGSILIRAGDDDGRVIRVDVIADGDGRARFSITFDR